MEKMEFFAAVTELLGQPSSCTREGVRVKHSVKGLSYGALGCCLRAITACVLLSYSLIYCYRTVPVYTRIQRPVIGYKAFFAGKWCCH